MAKNSNRDLLAKLADAGEEAINRLGDAPGMDRVLGYANSTRDRLDELTKRVRGIDELEKRIAKLEKQLAAASGTAAAKPKRKTTGTKRTGAGKGSTAKTGPSSPG